MRGFMSVLLLLAQFQPLVGVALCQGLAKADASLMEDGCPMPATAEGRATERVPDPPTGSALTAAASLHDCVFAEACLNASSAVIAAEPGFPSVPSAHDQAFGSASSLHGFEELPPPIPPPNS